MIRSGVITLLLIVACASVAPSQRGKVDPSGLLPRHGNLDGGYASTVSAADKAYAMGRLNEIERIILKAAPEFGRLKMFVEISGLSGIPKANTILNYRYNLVAEEASCVVFYVYINETPRGEPDGAEFEHFFTKAVPGADITINKLVPPPDPSYEEELFVRDGEVPYHHLTREELRRWQIIEREGRNGEKLAAQKQLLATTPYQRFMAEAPERKKNRDDLRAALKASGLSAAQIDAQIREMESSERETAADLKAQDANDRAQNDSMSRAPTDIDKARVSIARMSPTERSLPAYIKQQGGNADTLFEFGTASTPFVGRVVRPNLAFWNAHRSRVEVRTLHVGFTAACPKEPPPPDVHAALWKLRQNIDWAALKRMVNQP